MNLTWPQWILFGCAVASLLFIAIGAIRALVALQSTMARARATQELVEGLNIPSASANALRMNRAVAAMLPLADRAKAAVALMNQSVQELKLPEAMAALRAAAMAVKLLFSGR